MAERVRVREITNVEGNKLLSIVRRGTGSVVRWRRAQVVLWSAQGMDVPQIATIAFTSEDRVREVIRNFTPTDSTPWPRSTQADALPSSPCPNAGRSKRWPCPARR